MAGIVDSDQHLFEYRGLWEERIDPALRADALRMQDDALGHTQLVWRERRICPVDVSDPGETDAIGERRRRERAGLPPLRRYDEALPRDYWEPAARLANMRAWNRWCAEVAADGGGRLHPVLHLHLGDAAWLEAELAAAARAGVRLAMVAPALVDGRPLSHPALDRVWALFVEHGVTPVFHVADQPRPFGDAWYTDGELGGVPVLESVFLWTPAALAATDLIVNGVFARHPGLRLGIVELSAVWLPLYRMMLDGGVAFVNRLHGERRVPLDEPGSAVFERHVRVSCFAYERPERIIAQSGGRDLLMACSDYPHSEGTATPVADYRRVSRESDPFESHPGLRSENIGFLLGR